MPYEETLKADLLREGVPEQFKPVKDKGISIITKEFNAHTTAIKSPEIKLVNSSDTTKRKYEPRSSYATTPSRERKDWFIPANDKMRSFGENIEYELMVRGHRVKMPDNSSKGDTGLRGAFQSVATSGKKPEQKLKASAKIYHHNTSKSRISQKHPKRQKCPGRFIVPLHHRTTINPHKTQTVITDRERMGNAPKPGHIQMHSYDLCRKILHNICVGEIGAFFY